MLSSFGATRHTHTHRQIRLISMYVYVYGRDYQVEFASCFFFHTRVKIKEALQPNLTQLDLALFTKWTRRATALPNL